MIGKGEEEAVLRQKRIFLHMAVFSFQIGDKSQDLPGAHIYGQDKAILLVKLQKNRFSPQRGFGTADLKDQVLQEQIPGQWQKWWLLSVSVLGKSSS